MKLSLYLKTQDDEIEKNSTTQNQKCNFKYLLTMNYYPNFKYNVCIVETE